jgi:hypothetical protein
MNSQDTKVAIEHTYPTPNGWLCEMKDGSEDRIVTTEELLEQLHAAKGLIPEPITTDNAQGEPITQVLWFGLQEWIAECGISRLEFHLEEVINEREGRTGRAKPQTGPALANKAERIAYLQNLVKTAA